MSYENGLRRFVLMLAADSGASFDHEFNSLALILNNFQELEVSLFEEVDTLTDYEIELLVCGDEDGGVVHPSKFLSKEKAEVMNDILCELF